MENTRTDESAPRRLRKGAELRCTPTSLSAEGEGLCPVGAFRVHVAGLLPGEGALCRVEHVSPHRREGQGEAGEVAAWATIRRRFSAAPERVTPRCAAYGRCGGCTLQHLAYPEQLRFKQQLLADTLRSAGVSLEDGGDGGDGGAGTLRPCVAAPREGYGQRDRIKLVAQSRGGAVYFGAYAPRSHEVVEMEGCALAAPLLIATVRAIAQAATEHGLSVYDERSGSGALRYLLLRQLQPGGPDAAQLQASLICAQLPPDPALAALAATLRARAPQLGAVALHHNPSRGNALLLDLEAAGDSGADRMLFGDPALWEQIGPARLRVSPRSFTQVQRAMAARVYADCAAALAPTAADRVLDIYCGIGAIGLTVLLAAPGARLLGIEANPAAVADAAASYAAAGLAGQVELRCADAAAALADPAGLSPATLVVLNPPRGGCEPAVIRALGALRPRRIAYLSCSPRSLARDLLLLQQAGYSVTSLTPYDMHPHTPHIETLAVLDRAA